MKKEVRTTKSGYPLMRYLSLLLAMALLFSGVTFARFALERRGSIDTGVALFDASYTVEGVNSLTFGNSYYWKDEGNRWYEQGSARTVRIQMKNNSDVNVRANVLHMEGPAEFWENIALQLMTVKTNDSGNGFAADKIVTTQYVLADLLRVRTGGIKENASGAILDADGEEATHQFEYGKYIAWSPSSTENGAEDGVFKTGFSDEFGQRGNVEESLQMSGGISAGWAEGDTTFDLSKVTSFRGSVTAVRQSASYTNPDQTGTTPSISSEPLTITITASMKEKEQYSVGFARRQEQRSLPAFYLDCEKKVPYYEIDITLPETGYFNMTTAKNDNTTSVIAFLTWTNSLQSSDLTTNVYRGSTNGLNWGGLTSGAQRFNGAQVVGYHFNYNDVPAKQKDEAENVQDILTTVRMNYKIGDTSPTWQHVASISSEDGVYAHNLQPVGGSYQCSGGNPVTIAKSDVEACGGIYGTHFKEGDFLWSTGEDESTEFCQATEKGYRVAFSVSFVQSSELPEWTGA